MVRRSSWRPRPSAPRRPWRSRSRLSRAGRVISRSGVAGIARTSKPTWRSALTTAGAGPSIGISPTPLAPYGPCTVGPLEDDRVDRRRVQRRRNDVVGQLRVGHAAVAHHHLLEQRVAERPAPCRPRSGPPPSPDGSPCRSRPPRSPSSAALPRSRDRPRARRRCTPSRSCRTHRRDSARRPTRARRPLVLRRHDERAVLAVIRGGRRRCRAARASPRAARCSSRPTIMHVRDATVGPLSGTRAVSAS